MSDLPFSWDRISLGVRILSRNGGVTMANHVEVALINEIERLRAALQEVIDYADDMNSYDAGRVARAALEGDDG